MWGTEYWGQGYWGSAYWGPDGAIAAPPGQASNPNPADAATGVSLAVVLSWDAGSFTDSHDVYFGTNPTITAPDFQGNQAGTTFDPPGLLNLATTYYWRIDEVNAEDTTTGIVWSFTTTSDIPGGDPDTSFQPPARFSTSGDALTMFPWKK